MMKQWPFGCNFNHHQMQQSTMIFIVAPEYMCNFQKLIEVHQHNTKNSFMSYIIPHVNSYGIKSFMYNAAKAWNSLPIFLKSIECKNTFKYKCKSFLFNRMAELEKSDFVM